MIRSNLDLLRVQKERRDGEKLPYRVIASRTGLSPSTLVRLMNSDFDRVDVATLNALCRFFECSLCDVLEYVPDQDAGVDPRQEVTA